MPTCATVKYKMQVHCYFSLPVVFLAASSTPWKYKELSSMRQGHASTKKEKPMFQYCLVLGSQGATVIFFVQRSFCLPSSGINLFIKKRQS